ncbi:MAG: energy transducer TonB [Ginsengibacter sp.]
MNYSKFKSGSLAIFISAMCFTACDDSSTSSSETSSVSSAGTDTTLSSPIAMDTTANAMKDTSAMMDTLMANRSATSATPSKKKIKVSIENMAATKHLKFTMDKAGVYDFSEVMPAFKSGSSDIEDYINDHIEYPQPAIDDSKEGKVIVNFVVDENGKITNAHTTGGKLGEGLDEEAVRVVSGMPAWTPGKVKGKPVKVSMSLPISFKIEE